MGIKANERPFVATPKCYVVARQVFDNRRFAQFLRDEGHDKWETEAPTGPQKLVEVAGRICYMSFDKGRPHEEYLANILAEGHGSVLEHAVFSMVLTGVSRAFTHELVRHRAGMAYSQLSQRFVDEDDGQVVCPEMIRACKGDPIYGHIYDYWVETCKRQFAAYSYLKEALHNKLAMPSGEAIEKAELVKLKTLNRKKVNGAARSVLPEATETKITATANTRALRNLFDQRGSHAADSEIRSVAIAIFEGVFADAPDIFGDYELYEHEEAGTCLRGKYKKV